MVNIYLCRHGQSQANATGVLAGHLDSPLTALGRQQAQKIAQLSYNAGLRFDHIYASPLARALDTAKIIAKTTGSPEPEVLADLIERDFGILTGKSYLDIEKYATKFLKTDEVYYFLDAKDSETFPQALQRAKKVLKKILANHQDGKVLLATHGDIGMMIFAAFHQTPWKEALTQFDFGNSELLLLKEDLRHKPHVFEIKEVT